MITTSAVTKLMPAKHKKEIRHLNEVNERGRRVTLTQTTGPCCQHVDEFRAVVGIEGLHANGSILQTCASVQTTVFVAAPDQIIFQDVKHTGELREDEHPMALCLHFGQQFVEHNHFAAIVDNVLRQGKMKSQNSIDSHPTKIKLTSSVVYGGPGSAPSNRYG